MCSPVIWKWYWASFSSYQKQVLTVMISPLCTDCHVITDILLNVELQIIHVHLTLHLQRHIPTYLHVYIYIFIRIIDFIKFLLVIFLSWTWWVSICIIKFILHNSLTQCSIFRAVRKLTFWTGFYGQGFQQYRVCM